MKRIKKYKNFKTCLVFLLLILPGLFFGQNPQKEKTKSFSIKNGTIPAIFHTIDYEGDVGMYSSISAGPDGQLYFSYYDNTNKDLKFAKGRLGVYQVDSIDYVGDVGKYSCINIDGSGHKNIVYFDDTKNTLKYAGWLRTWEFDTIDAEGDVGQYSSICLDANNQLSISYYDNTNQNLKFANQNDKGWTTQVVDETGQVGKYSCLVIDSLNHNNIVYFDDTKNTLKYAGWLRTWEFETVDAVGDVGQYSSMYLDANNQLNISYYDNSNQNLKLANQSRKGWTTQVVDETGDVGKYSCLVIDSLNHNNIVYFDETKNTLKYAGWLRTWEFETVDAEGDVGQYSSIVCNDYNQLFISYYDVSNQDLKFASGNTNSWEIETVTETGDVGKFSTLAVSKPEHGNKGHIIFFDDSQNKLMSADKNLPLAEVGNIAGLVTDESSGLPIAEANVSAINDATAHVYAMQTNEEGSYEIKSIPPGVYTVKASKNEYSPQTASNVVVSTGGTTQVNFTLLNTFRTINFDLSEGWSGISIPIIPVDANIETMMNPILSNLIIFQNETGFYWPGQNINTLVNWDMESGYSIKVTEDVTLSVSGSRANNHILQLSPQWNLIPVLSECEVEIMELFEGTNIVMVKEVAGWNIYWPEFGINTLQVLDPGKAYFVLMDGEGEIVFPECDGSKSSVRVGNQIVRQPADWQSLVPWVLSKPTAITHTIAIPADAVSEIQSGDIIAAFNENGNCFGLALWENENTSITLFGNDRTTAVKDGFAEGEELTFKLMEKESGQEHNLEVSFDKSLPNAELRFQNNGLSALASLKVSSTGLRKTTSVGQPKIIPNPAQDEFVLKLDAEIILKGSLTIYSLDGQPRGISEITRSETPISIDHLTPGVYILEIEVDGNRSVKRLIKR